MIMAPRQNVENFMWIVVLSCVVMLGWTVTAKAQPNYVDDPLALYVNRRVQFGWSQYCMVDWSLGVKSCRFDDIGSCAEARATALRSSNPLLRNMIQSTSCERNPAYQPSDKD